MTFDLRPYPEYKDSGLPWLGPVPAHWNCLRCKYIFREVDERSELGKETHLSMSQRHGLIPSGGLEGKRLQSESYAGGKLCRVNDLVLNRLKAHLGVFAYATQPGVVSPDYTVLRPIHGDDVVFFELVFKTPDCTAELRRSTKGIVEGFWRLYTDDLYNIRVPVPPVEERDIILRFVNAFDTDVRRFIRNRRRLIDVLNEQKQAIINRAVTRGLDPSAPLKSTGIAWLDDTPEHWVVKPLKRWVSINAFSLPEWTDPDFTFDYLDIGCIGTGLLMERPARIRFGDAPSRARRILRTGDTIISTVRTYLRAVYFIDNVPKALVASTGFAVLTPGPDVLPELLGIALQSDSFINRVTAHSIGIAYPAIAETRVAALPLAIAPSKPEQAKIVEYVRRETRTMTEAILKAQREIGLIREYRTRLIADVVTGKLDVRHLAASLDAEAPLAEDMDDGLDPPRRTEAPGDDEPALVEESFDE
jgi:type I restriction enzyme S subunit